MKVTKIIQVITTAVLAWVGSMTVSGPVAGAPQAAFASYVRLPGHVLDALQGADRVEPTAAGAQTSMTLTLVLRRDDPVGFERYMREVYDQGSGQYRHFLTQRQLADRFGPSLETYGNLIRYLRGQGVRVTAESGHRMTLTVSGTRAAVEQAFQVSIDDYRSGGTGFYANSTDPALPAALAAHVQSVSGLNDLGTPRPAEWALACLGAKIAELFGNGPAALDPGIQGVWGVTPPCKFRPIGPPNTPTPDFFTTNQSGTPNPYNNSGGYPGGGSRAVRSALRSRATGATSRSGAAVPLTGVGQKIGLLEFSYYTRSDVADYLALNGAAATQINQLSDVPVNGGATVDANTSEVLLDIDAVMSIAPAANVVVYHAPFDGRASGYVALFSAMIDGGVTIISNSWASCEDQVSQADAQGIDAVLQTAAAAGISVFNGTGDTGSTCLDGSTNTISVPADSPNATAVGGSSLTPGPAYTYGSETWWDGTAGAPPTGQGGYGVSRYFAQPSYQAKVSTASMRSIPDVVINADPTLGISICQASAGGCPSGLTYGGTSLAAPEWAALTALLNQAQVAKGNVGAFNALLYSVAATPAFHNAASMGSDVAHVGLGSPNLDQLYLALTGQIAGTPVAANSSVLPLLPASVHYAGGTGVPSDGTPGAVMVLLVDANGHTVAGKTVTLTSSSGNVSITPASLVTSASNGTAVFTVTDQNVEDVTFTATDSTDGVTLSTAVLSFVPPAATSAGITANPPTAPADGQSTATVTVTLKDSTNRPTPGKTVTISDGNAHAVITGPTTGVTDSNGTATFTVTDQVNETVTFTAVDVTDSSLPVPGSATVTYSGSVATACGVGVVPTAASGYIITPYISGLPAAANLFYNGVNEGCPGATNPAFPATGNVLAADFLNGSIYQTDLSGGAVSSNNVTATLSPLLANLTFGKDGSLYATTGSTGATLLQLNPATGAVIRTVAAGLTCPTGLTVDPLSGDLFFDDDCTGGGTDDPSIYRVIDPANSDPNRPTSVVVYATLPSTANGPLAFAPNGTLYAVSGYYGNINAPVEQISATSAPSVTVTPVTGITSDFAVAIGAVNADGSAQSLLVEPAGTLSEVPIANPGAAVVLATGSPGVGVTGPDGCLYSAHYDTIYRLTNSSGNCSFAPTNPGPSVKLTPGTVPANPSQGASQTFTATLQNVSPLSGVPVYFIVGGANPQIAVATTDAGGNATLTYVGAQTGSDTVKATTTLDNQTLASNTVKLTWAAGKHVTQLSLNPGPHTGTVAQAANLVASLWDVSVTPPVAVTGQSIGFELGAATCTAMTGSAGTAGCSATPGQAGVTPLSATFTGSAQYAAATDSTGFRVAAGATTTAPPVTVSASAKSGGGALGWKMILGLLGVLGLRFLVRESSRGGFAVVLVVGGLLAVAGGPAQADQPGWLDPFYVGVRAGTMPVRLSSGTLQRGLVGEGFDTVTATTDTSGAGGTVFVGYELAPYAGLELGYTYRNATDAHLNGTIPSSSNLTSLLQDTTGLIRGYGNIASLSYAARFEVAPRISLEPRLGGFFWATKVTAASLDERVDSTHEGGGVTAGLTAAYRLVGGLEIGINVDHFHGFPTNNATLYGGSVEWRFGH